METSGRSSYCTCAFLVGCLRSVKAWEMVASTDGRIDLWTDRWASRWGRMATYYRLSQRLVLIFLFWTGARVRLAYGPVLLQWAARKQRCTMKLNCTCDLKEATRSILSTYSLDLWSPDVFGRCNSCVGVERTALNGWANMGEYTCSTGFFTFSISNPFQSVVRLSQCLSTEIIKQIYAPRLDEGHKRYEQQRCRVRATVWIAS